MCVIFIYLLIDLIDGLIDCLIRWLIDWLIDRSIDWLIDSLIDWLTDYIILYICHTINTKKPTSNLGLSPVSLAYRHCNWFCLQGTWTSQEFEKALKSEVERLQLGCAWIFSWMVLDGTWPQDLPTWAIPIRTWGVSQPRRWKRSLTALALLGPGWCLRMFPVESFPWTNPMSKVNCLNTRMIVWRRLITAWVIEVPIHRMWLACSLWSCKRECVYIYIYIHTHTHTYIYIYSIWI